MKEIIKLVASTVKKLLSLCINGNESIANTTTIVGTGNTVHNTIVNQSGDQAELIRKKEKARDVFSRARENLRFNKEYVGNKKIHSN